MDLGDLDSLWGQTRELIENSKNLESDIVAEEGLLYILKKEDVNTDNCNQLKQRFDFTCERYMTWTQHVLVCKDRLSHDTIDLLLSIEKQLNGKLFNEVDLGKGVNLCRYMKFFLADIQTQVEYVLKWEKVSFESGNPYKFDGSCEKHVERAAPPVFQHIHYFKGTGNVQAKNTTIMRDGLHWARYRWPARVSSATAHSLPCAPAIHVCSAQCRARPRLALAWFVCPPCRPVPRRSPRCPPGCLAAALNSVGLQMCYFGYNESLDER